MAPPALLACDRRVVAGPNLFCRAPRALTAPGTERRVGGAALIVAFTGDPDPTPTVDAADQPTAGREFRIAFQTFDGVSGMSMWRTPR
jgi:hypothetical protein